jgi:hypothetical protein
MKQIKTIPYMGMNLSVILENGKAIRVITPLDTELTEELKCVQSFKRFVERQIEQISGTFETTWNDLRCVADMDGEEICALGVYTPDDCDIYDCFTQSVQAEITDHVVESFHEWRATQ